MKQTLRFAAASLLLASVGFLPSCQKSSKEELPIPKHISQDDQNVRCTTTTQTISFGGQVQLVYTIRSCTTDGVYQFQDYPTTWGDSERDTYQGSGGSGIPGSTPPPNAFFERIGSDLQLTAGTPPTEPLNYNCTQQRSSPATRRGLDTFVMDNYGNTRTACVTQGGWYDPYYDYTVRLPKGPSVRYVRDPLNPTLTIDLQRMLVLGNWGLNVATSNEIAYYMTYSDNYSTLGYNDRDFFSLQLGNDFYANYASQLAANPTNFAQLVSDFLNDPTQRTAYTDGSKCR